MHALQGKTCILGQAPRVELAEGAHGAGARVHPLPGVATLDALQQQGVRAALMVKLAGAGARKGGRQGRRGAALHAA